VVDDPFAARVDYFHNLLLHPANPLEAFGIDGLPCAEEVEGDRDHPLV